MNDPLPPRESVVICEGYHDRAFWDGWLLHLGCVSQRPARGSVVTDPFGERVDRGKFAYQTPTGEFVLVEPVGSKDNVRPAAAIRLKNRTDRSLTRLVLNVDADTNADGTPSQSKTMSRESAVDVMRGVDPNMLEEADGSLKIDGGGTTINLIRWETADAHIDGLPNQQTLERLVCAAICAVYGGRRQAVHQWLASRPNPPSSSVEEHAWSYMAGWYPDHGCEAFYTLLWQDEPVAKQLEVRLRESGAWKVAEALTV